jgi:adenylate cyclase
LTQICGQPPLFSLERQMLSWLTVLTALTLFLASIENAILHIPGVGLSILVGAVHLGLYVLVRFKHASVSLIGCIVFTLDVLDLTVGWLSNDGINGSITFFYVLSIVAVLTLFKGRLRLFWMVVIIGHFFAMLVLQYLYPELITPYASRGARYFDMAFSFAMMIAFTIGYVGLNTYNLDERREVADSLLRNILPVAIAEKLKYSPAKVVAEHHDNASILFADIVGFTPLSAQLIPVELVELLNTVFSFFDTLTEKYGVEKIKTVGDCYMVAAGVPSDQVNHAQVLTELALEMRDYVSRHELLGRRLDLRIGINSGPVVAGVIGHKKFTYDLWGDAVNTASRMESHGKAGVIQVTQTTYELIKDAFVCEPQGCIDVKGKGAMEVWHVVAAKS